MTRTIVPFTVPAVVPDDLYCAQCGAIPSPESRWLHETVRDVVSYVFCDVHCANAHADKEAEP